MISAPTALGLFAAAALAVDLLLRARDAWRRRGVLATGADRAVDVQHVEARRA